MIDEPTLLRLIDIGNSTIHWASYDGEWGPDRRLRTREIDAFGAQIDSEIEVERSRGQARDCPEVAVICSGVPDGAERVSAELERRRIPVLLLGHSLKASMPVRYHDPAQLGQDRLANAAGAYRALGCSVLVVDVGTAITVDAVSDDGAFLGGAIAPGLERAWHGLISGVRGPSFRTVDAPWLERGPGRHVGPIGHSTQACLDAGLRIGLAGLIDRLIREQRGELGDEVPVLWTGGAAALLREHSEEPGQLDELLTLKGLVAIYEADHTLSE